MKRPYNCILNDPGKIVIVRPSYGIISTLSLPFQLPQGATGEGVSNESAETSSKKKKKKKKKRKRFCYTGQLGIFHVRKRWRF